MTPGPMELGVGGVEAAHAAVQDLKARQARAREAMVDFALRALFAGESVEAVMRACGFEADPEPEGKEYEDENGNRFSYSFGSIFDSGYPVKAPSPREQFAAWISEEFKKRITNEVSATGYARGGA